MKPMRILIFFISLLTTVVGFSQNEKPQDSTPQKTYRYGLRVGADLSKLIKTALNSDHSTFEINADYRFSKRYYIAGEFGNEKRTIDDTQVNFTTKGSYFKAGIDYNAYENWLDMENAIFTGLRYGVSSYSHTLNTHGIYNTDTFWNEINLVDTPRDFNGITSHWLELIVGIKAEVFSNLYLGVNVQLKSLIVNNEPDNFDNLYIPGFGKTYDGSNWGVGFSYTVSYFIPFYKK